MPDREEVLRLAIMAGYNIHEPDPFKFEKFNLERFAKLIAEECALCVEVTAHDDDWEGVVVPAGQHVTSADELASAIRSRFGRG